MQEHDNEEFKSRCNELIDYYSNELDKLLNKRSPGIASIHLVIAVRIEVYRDFIDQLAWLRDGGEIPCVLI